MLRLEKLKKEARSWQRARDEFFIRFYKEFEKENLLSFEEKYAESFYAALTALTPSIIDGELIAGRYKNTLSSEEQAEWDETYRHIAQAMAVKCGPGQDSHMTIDYELILKCGINGIIEKIDGYLAACEKDKIPFYSVCRRCLEAVVKHSENYADEAVRLAQQEKSPERKAELLKIAEVCRNVPANPAESFYEAVQSVHFVTYCISYDPFTLNFQQFQLGHPDRYLLPYYLSDIESGVMTKDEAQLILDCLGIQINNRVPNGLSSGYMVGGRDENGNIVANDLTTMCMQVVDDIRLVYPAVGLCYAEGMDDFYLEKACEILSHGCSHPAIFNDEVITKGLESYGATEKESHNYIHSTCVEITPEAASNVWVASPYTNMPQILLDVMDREYDTFDNILSAVFKKLDGIIKENFEVQNEWRKTRLDNSIKPLLSCFVNDCLARGKDIEKGGARYNWIMPSFVGVANLVDSLYVIKETVFDKKEFSLKELKKMVDNNFECSEAVRLRLLNGISKYGNDIDEVDGYFKLITEHIIAECKKYMSILPNGNLIPSVFCWQKHERFGRETGATPDGRKAGFPLGDGSGPCQGREMNGPTASILSSTKWEHHQLIGGVAVNMKFSSKSLGAHSAKIMKNLVKTYLKRGGFEMQINVVDKETLEKAVKNPEEYKDLVVRIGGYSDYFVTLSPEMQQEVILRTEHII